MDRPGVKVGILGAGHFAKTYAQVLAKQNASVVAVAARDENKAKALFPGATVFASWKTLVRDAQIDLLVVCLPISMHFDVIMFALDQNKVILSEKPVAASLEQAEQLLERYSNRKSNHVWMVAENYRLEPAFSRGEQIVKALGGVKSFHFHACHAVATNVGVFNTEWRKEKDFSYISDSAVHYVAALRRVFGLNFDDLVVEGSVRSKLWPLMPGQFDTVSCSLRHAQSGAVGQFFCSFGQFATAEVRLLVCCSNGNFVIERFPGKYVVTTNGGKVSEDFPWSGIDKEVQIALEVAQTGCVADEHLSPEQAIADMKLVHDMMTK